MTESIAVTESVAVAESCTETTLLAGVLTEQDWQAREASHHARVDGWTAGRRDRGPVGARHPVDDFLWTYYSHRPARLRRWHPGAGIVLGGDAARARLQWRRYTELSGGVGVDIEAFVDARRGALTFVRELLEATRSRPAQLGCFGLHEWAMVYRLQPGDQRHEDWPLRLGAAGTDAVVESQPLRCTHFDAFRFFTTPARPLNLVQPRREQQVALEQPGCLHATMDLYKWAYKLVPAVPSSLVSRCFELAREVRLLDMRASPYDLSALGLTPVPVETPAGRAEYVGQQRAFAERGQELRSDLVGVCDTLLTCVSSRRHLGCGAR